MRVKYCERNTAKWAVLIKCNCTEIEVNASFLLLLLLLLILLLLLLLLFLLLLVILQMLLLLLSFLLFQLIIYQDYGMSSKVKSIEKQTTKENIYYLFQFRLWTQKKSTLTVKHHNDYDGKTLKLFTFGLVNLKYIYELFHWRTWL